MSEVGNTKQPVSTWRLHNITGWPICWLFHIWDGRAEDYIAFVYDDAAYRVYQGTMEGGLQVVEGIEVHGRRWEEPYPDKEPEPGKESGVEIVVLKDGLVFLDSKVSSYDPGISSFWMRNMHSGQMVSGIFVEIKDFRIAITPEKLTLAERDTKQEA